MGVGKRKGRRRTIIAYKGFCTPLYPQVDRCAFGFCLSSFHAHMDRYPCARGSLPLDSRLDGQRYRLVTPLRPPPLARAGGRRGRRRGGRGSVQCQPAPPPGEFPARPAPCARGGNNPMPTQRPSGSTGRRECLIREQGRAVAPAFLCDTGDIRWLSWGR